VISILFVYNIINVLRQLKDNRKILSQYTSCDTSQMLCELVIIFPLQKWLKYCHKIVCESGPWSIVLELELLFLAFVLSIRQKLFSLFVDCLRKLAEWFFVCDQTNYARWLPVHIRDMLALKQPHPDIYSQFTAGCFSLSKSQRKFSSIAVDRAHEQLNAVI